MKPLFPRPPSSLRQIGGNNPQYEEFKARTLWSLSNAFTSAFKELEPIPQFKVTAKLGEFLETRFSQSLYSAVGGTGRDASSPCCWHPSGRQTLRHRLPLRLIDRGSDAKTLAKEANGPMKEGMGYKSPVVDWIADAGRGYDT